MDKKPSGSRWKYRRVGIRPALAGLRSLFLYEYNARIHLAAALLAVVAGIVLDISGTEWLAIVLVIGFVFATELINSAVEALADVVTADYDDRIRRIKDYCAGAVLVAASVSVIVGLAIFVPKITAILNG